MLKLKRALSERLPPLILYMEDVEKIYHILAKLNPNVKISTADYAFDNLEELKQAGIERTNYLFMHITEPSISLKLEPYTAALLRDEDTHDQKGAVENIRQVLFSRRQYLALFLQSGVLAGVFIGFSAWYLFPGVSRHDVGQITIGLTTLIVGLVWSWWAIIRSHTVYPTIYLSKK